MEYSIDFVCLCIGVVVDVPGVANPFVMTAHVICCTCDLPGKALVQNIFQFNGAYGCGFCEQPGKNLQCSCLPIPDRITKRRTKDSGCLYSICKRSQLCGKHRYCVSAEYT